MNDDHRHESEREEQRLASLIRQGGNRLQPPAAVREAARASTRAEWRAVVAERAAAVGRRRATRRWSFVAAASVAGLAAWLAMPLLRQPAVSAGTIARVSGAIEVGRAGFFGGFAPARAGSTLMAGEEIHAGPGGRAALELGGVSLRVDQGSIVAVLAPDRVALRRGALYVDDGPGGDRHRLVIETDYGTVEHLGTQYETRVGDSALRVRVREGRVRLSGAQQVVEGTAGEQVTINKDGELRREQVARSGADWAWVGEITPEYDIENRRLGDFLSWVARESGRELSYASTAAAAEAANVVLRGSVRGLPPESALAAVLSTTRLGYRETPQRLVIDFRTGEGG